MGRCESPRAGLKNYTVDERFLYASKTVTYGTQKKYFDGQYYFKLDKVGNEGLCEYLASVLLRYSSIDKSLVVDYERCLVNGVPGCRSSNFLGRDEVFVTMDSVYRNLTGKTNLADRLDGLRYASDRLEFILDIASGAGADRIAYRDYLNCMMQLDLLIGNVDRHTHNYGIIVDSSGKVVRFPPLFDNGRSFNTDREDGSSCTLSGSFTEQVTVFGYPIRPAFMFSMEKVIGALSAFEGVYEFEQLKNRLAKYGEIWSETKCMHVF